MTDYKLKRFQFLKSTNNKHNLFILNIVIITTWSQNQKGKKNIINKIIEIQIKLK